MKKKSTLLGAFLLLLAAIAFRFFVAAQPPRDSFEIASWNMRWFPAGYMQPQPPKDESARISKAARIIRKQGVPDILFAQEIRDLETCATLASRLGDSAFRPAVCSAFADTATNTVAGLQQIAIFTRFRVLESGAEPWHATDFVSPPRGYAYAVLDIGGELLAVFNVHLKSNYIPAGLDVKQQETLNRLKRELSCRQLLDKARELRGKTYDGKRIAALVIGGDFNHSPYEPRFETEQSIKALFAAGFANAFEGLSGEEWATLPANQWYPAATFDYILTDGLRPILGTQKVLLENPDHGISDHRQIRVKLAFSKMASD